jgi:hypothetical protein
MISWLHRTFADPRIERHLIASEGEVVIDEVRHHWVVYVLSILEAGVVLVLLVATAYTPVNLAWLPLVPAGVIALHATYRALSRQMDRFVVTNMRVFRVRGVLDQRIGTMPIARILDITVDKPLLGRILGYGHITFESAAQEQGIRLIRYIPHPDRRDLTIQTVIQRAGLRAMVSGSRDADDGSGDEPPAAASPAPAAATRSRPVRADHPRLNPIHRLDDPRGRRPGRPGSRPRRG